MLQSMGSQRVGHNVHSLVTKQTTAIGDTEHNFMCFFAITGIRADPIKKTEYNMNVGLYRISGWKEMLGSESS